MTILVLVESPTKAKKIASILGNNYVVRASYGHVCDMPGKSLGVDLNTMEESYEALPAKGGFDPSKTIRELKGLVAKASEVMIASDPDREGEAIAWHLKRLLGIGKYKRVEIHEITQRGITDAISKSRLIDADMVEAQRSRRVIDRLLGYWISPFLSRGVSGGKSAGRVQSAALMMLAQRDREIAAFKPKDIYSIEANFDSKGTAFTALLQETPHVIAMSKLTIDENEDKKFSIKKLLSSTDLKAVLAEIKAASSWSVASTVDKEIRISPRAPMVTSTMQQVASRRFGWSGEKTMAVAQVLFENGAITYMRTDSVRIAPEAQEEAAIYIGKKYGAEYVPAKPPEYKNQDAAQNAHEAIRPAHADMETVGFSSGKATEGDQAQLYTLIREAFLASQSVPGTNILTRVNVVDDAGRFSFMAESSVRNFPGYRKIFNDEDEAVSAGLKVEKGPTSLKKATQKASKTRAKPHYREDTMTHDLEKNGVGRPSSYANVLKTLMGRAYITESKRDLIVSALGFQVCDWLTLKTPQYVDMKYTADMESTLDSIAAGKSKRVPLLSAVRDDLRRIFGDMVMSGGSGETSIKQKEILEKIRAGGQTVPAAAFTNAAVARPILDAWFNSKVPSEKQIEYARKLAESTGMKYTREMLLSSKATSEFIDKAMKKTPSKVSGKSGAPASKASGTTGFSGRDGKPTEKQLSYAESLAKKKGVPLPKECLESFSSTSEFINSMK